MVLEVLAHAWQINDGVDSETLEIVQWPDSRQQEYLGAIYGAGTKNDFSPNIELGGMSPTLDVNAYGPPPVEADAGRQLFGPNVKVRSRSHLVQKGPCAAHPFSTQLS